MLCKSTWHCLLLTDCPPVSPFGSVPALKLSSDMRAAILFDGILFSRFAFVWVEYFEEEASILTPNGPVGTLLIVIPVQ